MHYYGVLPMIQLVAVPSITTLPFLNIISGTRYERHFLEIYIHICNWDKEQKWVRITFGFAHNPRTAFLWWVNVDIVFPAAKSHNWIFGSIGVRRSRCNIDKCESTYFYGGVVAWGYDLRVYSVGNDGAYRVCMATKYMYLMFRPHIPHLNK